MLQRAKGNVVVGFKFASGYGIVETTQNRMKIASDAAQDAKFK